MDFGCVFPVVRRHAVFLGRPHRTWLRQEPLHIQRVLQVNRTLYIGARYDGDAMWMAFITGFELFFHPVIISEIQKHFNPSVYKQVNQKRLFVRFPSVKLTTQESITPARRLLAFSHPSLWPTMSGAQYGLWLRFSAGSIDVTVNKVEA